MENPRDERAQDRSGEAKSGAAASSGGERRREPADPSTPDRRVDALTADASGEVARDVRDEVTSREQEMSITHNQQFASNRQGGQGGGSQAGASVETLHDEDAIEEAEHELREGRRPRSPEPEDD